MINIFLFVIGACVILRRLLFFLKISHAFFGYLSAKESFLKELRYAYIAIYVSLLCSLSFNALAGPDWNTTADEIALPNTQVNGLVKDTFGRIWIATSKGVMVYDGSDMLPFPQLPQLSFRHIAYLKNNKVWVAGNSEIWLIDCRTLKAEKLLVLKKEATTITALTRGYDSSSLFFALSNGDVYRITLDRKIKRYLRTGKIIRRMDEGNEGDFYYASEGVLYGYMKKTGTIFKTAFKPFGGYTHLSYSNRQLIGATWYKGLFILSLPDKKQQQSALLENINKLNTSVTAAGVANSSIFVAYDNYSFYRYDRRTGQLQDISKEHPEIFYGKQIKCVFADGPVVWVGTTNSLIKISTYPSKFVRLLNDRLPIVSTRSIIKDSNDLYVASYSGIYYRQDKKPWVNLNSGLGRKSKVFPYSMLKSGNTLYMGLEASVMYQMDIREKQLKALAVLGKSSGKPKVYAMLLAPTGDIWLGTGSSIVKLDTATGMVSNYPEGYFDVKGGKVNHLYYNDSEQHLYAATDTGLYVFSLNGKLNFSITRGNTKGLGSNQLTFTAIAVDGSIWIGTRDSGLYHLSGNKILEHLTTAEGLSDNRIYGFLFDRNGRLWISTNRGLSSYDPQLKTFYNCFVVDGLSSNEFNSNSLLAASDSLFYFGGINGINSFNPLMLEQTRVPFSIFISNVKRWNRDGMKTVFYTPGMKLVKSSADFSISLTLGTSDYRQQSKVSFFYSIEGVTDGWVKIRDPYYSFSPEGLHSGSYDVKIKAVNFRGTRSNNTLHFRIKLLAPVYYRWWFIIAVVAVMALIVYLIVRYRFRELKKYQELRVKIASDLHDEVGGLLTGIGMYSDNLASNKNLNDNAFQRAGKISMLSRQAISSMRDILWSIDARNDRLAALEEQVRSVAEEILTPKNISLEIRFENNTGKKRYQEIPGSSFIFLRKKPSITLQSTAPPIW